MQRCSRPRPIPIQTGGSPRVRTLLAEETRLGMMVGVAVGWAIADELKTINELEE